jgi:cytochrome b6-f complex iron-sulfur subunit
VGTLADLKDNQLLIKDGFKPGPVLIGQDPKNPKTLVAVNPTCTHAGCDVDWKGENFTCSCHGSAFAADGKVTRGPAKDPLPTYTVKLDGENILVAAPKV